MQNTNITEDGIKKYYHGAWVMPQQPELEEAVLGSLLLEKHAFDNAVGIHRDLFYQEHHKNIFDAIEYLHSKDRPIDLLTTMERLQTMGKLKEAGGPAYLAELTNRVASSANIEYYTAILQQEYVRRECIRVGVESIRDGLDQSVDGLQLVSSLEAELFKLTGRFITKAINTGSQIATSIRTRIKTIIEAKDELIGLATGFSELDDLLNGLQAPDVMCIAARPGMGKTAFAMCIVRNIAILRGTPVGLFSLEMSADQLGDRLVSIESHVPGNKVTDPRKADGYEMTRINSALDKIDASPIYIDDTPDLTITQLRSKARKMVREHGCRLIIIDYLQLMEGSEKRNGNREQEISGISRGVKSMAKELNVPVIELSQLSRAVEMRPGKRPQLSDLRESGSIEQDCDQVAFIYRPEYYGYYEDAEGNSTRGLAEIIIAKNRRGSVKTIKLEFVNYYTQFRDYVEKAQWEQESVAVIDAPPADDDEDLPF